MHQHIEGHHKLDADGNPAGGVTTGLGIVIHWQNGPLGRGTERRPPNGAFVEGVLAAALDRLTFYQEASDGRFRCAENAEALEHISAALAALNRRTQAREARAVEGTHTP